MDDKISQLPENIIHHILSYLVTTKDAARISLFCKKWHGAWLSCPTLYFRDNFGHPTDKWFKVLRRYQDQKIPIEQLILHVPDRPDSSQVSILNECIGIAVQNGVKKLELVFLDDGPDVYTLPCTIFEAKTLRELTVGGKVELKKGADNEVMFGKLQKLHLLGIYIDDNLFEDIIKRCPLIDDLYMYNCKGLKRIKVTNAYNLKKFTYSPYHDKAIEIDAPNLEYLNCAARRSLNLYTTRKLKYLSLVGILPSATSPDDFMHKFPHLEDLTLKFLVGIKRINITSHSLKCIKLGPDNQESLKEVKIEAPRLVSLSLDFRFGFYPALSLANAPSHQWVSNISFGPDHTFQFSKLKEYLSKLAQSKISLALRFNADECFDDVGHNSISHEVVIEVEHIDLTVSYRGEGLMINPNFLDALFQTCHPKAITGSRDEEATCKFLHENLIGRRRNHDRHENKSWHGDLKEVRFETYDETTQEYQPRDWNDILEDMVGKDKKRKASSNWDKICFRLEWEV